MHSYSRDTSKRFMPDSKCVPLLRAEFSLKAVASLVGTGHVSNAKMSKRGDTRRKANHLKTEHMRTHFWRLCQKCRQMQNMQHHGIAAKREAVRRWHRCSVRFICRKVAAVSLEIWLLITCRTTRAHHNILRSGIGSGCV